MKKSVIILFSIFMFTLLSGCGKKDDLLTLNVYNWGQYISDGSEGTLDVNKEFISYYKKKYNKDVKINYTTYATNEDMYNKIKSGAAAYDVITPSDYMIEKMIKEDMLLKLDFKNIPNYKYIDAEFKDLFFDKNNEYSVPYTYGMVGIIYNTKMVDEKDIGSWELMWNEKYKGKILQFNNVRDATGTAIYYNGDDVNSKDKKVWRDAIDLLKKQKSLVQSYVMDEIFNKMKNGSAAIAPYYAGDYLTMRDSNEDLRFYYPKEGTNVFVDSMCIPTTCKNKKLAEEYINFMLNENIGIANAQYLGYSSPNNLVKNNSEYIESMHDWHDDAMEVCYPSNSNIKKTYFESLDYETLKYQNELWEELKIDNSTEPWVYITSSTIVILLLLSGIINFIKKKIRNRY